MIAVDPDRVTVAGGLTFGCIHAPHFLAALAAALKPNPTSAEMFGRMVQPLKLPDMQPPGASSVDMIRSAFGLIEPAVIVSKLVKQEGCCLFALQAPCLARCAALIARCGEPVMRKWNCAVFWCK